MQEASVCRLCLCPAVDGGVPASQVDKDKLEDWCFNFMEHDLADEVQDEDVFCFFCVWDAQLLLNEFKDEIETSDLRWWPEEESKSTEVLKKSYLTTDGVRQSSVPLKKIGNCKTLKECIYCGKLMKRFGSHMNKIHANLVIRCKLHKCATYFHTLNECRLHEKRVHKILHKKLHECLYCGKSMLMLSYHRHVRQVHFMMERCTVDNNCKLHFYTKEERDSHIQLQHQSEKREILDCAKNGPIRRSKRVSAKIC